MNFKVLVALALALVSAVSVGAMKMPSTMDPSEKTGMGNSGK